MTLRRIGGNVVIGCGAAVILWIGVYMRFSNPDWTSTRLFIQTWPEIVLALLLVFGGLLIRGY